jgi:hypothetical protein
MIQSLNAGFNARSPSEYLSPLSKIARHRWEQAGRCGVQPAAISRSHIRLQAMAAFLRPSWLPVWFWSISNRRPCSELSRMQARLPLPLQVGVGQNEQPLAEVRRADFRRR